MKGSMEESDLGESPLEHNVNQKHIAVTSKSDNGLDHQNEHANGVSHHFVCSDDHDISLKKSSSEEEKYSVQCKDELRSHVEVDAEYIDLPHTPETRPSENDDHSMPKLKYQTVCFELDEFADEKELGLKYKEETTSKKLDTGSEDESSNSISSPLEVIKYLKCPRMNHMSQQNSIHVHMQYSSSQKIQIPAARKPSTNDSSVLGQHPTELSRLATYSEYPADCPVFVLPLAQDGFFYVHDEQLIQCNFCPLSIHLSELRVHGVTPVQLHSERSHQCPLKRRVDCGNVPVPKVVEDNNMPQNPSEGSDNNSLETNTNPTRVGTSVSVGSSADTNPTRVGTSVSVGSSADTKPTLVGTSVSVGSSVDTTPTLVSTSVFRGSASGNVTNSVPLIQKMQPPSVPPHRENVNSGVQQTKLQQPVASTAGSPGSVHEQPEPVTETANRNRSTAVSGNVNSNPPSASGGNETASSGATGQSKNSKSSKKTKNAKKPEVSKTETTKLPPAAVSGKSEQKSSSKTNASSSSGPSSSSGEQPKKKKPLTYVDLGIMAEKPKREDMAVLQKRLKTYEGKWKSSFAQTPEVLAECGMYYAGYADCARCFFCGGGLKNWEKHDEPWVEHARWFSTCAYVRLYQSPMFVEIVQRKNGKREKILMKDIEEEIKQKSTATNAGAAKFRDDASTSSSEVEYTTIPSSTLVTEKDLKKLEKEQEELLGEIQCRICMDETSNVVFLPCGHMVACTTCAIALKICPLCRMDIKGSVKALMD